MSSVLTTIRWLAMPRRTRVENPCSAKNAFSASARAGTSATSPSRRMPWRRGATAPRVSDTDPLAVTSAAAMCPGSRSRPTIAAWEEERFLNTSVISARAAQDLTTKRARRPASLTTGSSCDDLPGAVGGAALLAVGVARARHRAVRLLGDAEHAGRLRLRDRDRVRVDRVAGQRQVGAGGDAGVQRGLDGTQLRDVGRLVGLLVGVVRLQGGLRRTRSRLGLGVLSLRALVQERGKSDRGEN